MLELTMTLAICAMITAAAMTFYGQAQEKTQIENATMERSGIGPSTAGKAQYASTPAQQTKVSNVDVWLHDLAQKLDAMQLSETCPGDEFASQSCATVGGYLVRRDMNGTISVSLLTRTAGGRPVANEVLRVVGSEPYLSNEIAARDLDAVKKQLIRTFMSR